MDLRRLRSFVAVAEEGHFGRAAQRLFLSPAAVTAHIQHLEREFGTALLLRAPVELTAAGQRLIRHARSLLAAADAAVEEMGDLRPPVEDQPLRIGVMGHGSAELTPACIQEFRRARPDVRLVLRPLDFTEHVTALVDHRVDVAFVRPAPVDDRISVDILTTEERIVVVPESWSVADASHVTLDEVLDLPYLSLPEHTPRPFSDYLYFSRARGGERPRRSPDRASTPHEVLTSAAAGRGAGSALRSFARYYPWPGTATVPVTDAPWEHSVLATRVDDSRAEVQLFRSLAARLSRQWGPHWGLLPETA